MVPVLPDAARQVTSGLCTQSSDGKLFPPTIIFTFKAIRNQYKDDLRESDKNFATYKPSLRKWLQDVLHQNEGMNPMQGGFGSRKQG